MNPPRESINNAQPMDLHQDLPLPVENDNDRPAHLAAPVTPATQLQPQQELPTIVAACQTRRSRIIKNTPRYDQSVSLHDQGIVAWELLIDQDEQNKKTNPQQLRNLPHKEH